MIAIPRSLRIAVAIALALLVFFAANLLIAAIYHWLFGTVGGNL